MCCNIFVIYCKLGLFLIDCVHVRMYVLVHMTWLSCVAWRFGCLFGTAANKIEEFSYFVEKSYVTFSLEGTYLACWNYYYSTPSAWPI
jgi:hypothetical protein